jgi:hypothetical protein
MKKMLFLERKVVSAMVTGLLLLAFSASNMAQETSTKPRLMQTLGGDQIEQTVQIFLGLSGQPAGEIHVDYRYPTAEMTFHEVSKPQKYELRGYARMKPGKRVKVEGQGILLAQSYLAEIMSRPTAVGGFLAAWQSVMRDVSRADPDFLPFNRIHWQMSGPIGNEELAAAEKRLGMPLPSIYRETMRRSGSWRVSLPNGFSFEMLAPAQLVFVSDWFQKYHAPVEWETPENQARRQQLRRDIVFALINNEPWVLRRSGTPCSDGQPSFAIAQTASEGFYVNEGNVCGENAQLEAIREQMLEALYRAFPTPEFTVVGNSQRFHIKRGSFSVSEKKTLRLYLEADHF